jgi:hypothetical protein
MTDGLIYTLAGVSSALLLVCSARFALDVTRALPFDHHRCRRCKGALTFMGVCTYCSSCQECGCCPCFRFDCVDCPGDGRQHGETYEVYLARARAGRDGAKSDSAP